jgi:NAD(P)-dependent dehydrogenase (short-subunit alcohol dehydrogenase family)
MRAGASGDAGVAWRFAARGQIGRSSQSKRNYEACDNPDHEPHKKARGRKGPGKSRTALDSGCAAQDSTALSRGMSTISEMFSLRGKVAVVTGGARHLGYDMASVFAEAGASVVITSRELASASKAAETLRHDHGVEALPLSLDQRQQAQVAAMVSAARAWKGRIDIFVNNAGGGSGRSAGHLFERDPADVEDLVQTNLVGVLHCCQAVGRIMGEQRSGKIINIASMAGLIGRDRRLYERNGMKGQPVDYAAAKAGVIGLTRDLAGLLSPLGVHVNAISPGGFARGNLPPGFIKDYGDRTPLGRMGRDGVDLKGAALFLASPASDYITGQNLVVDGGFTIWR